MSVTVEQCVLAAAAMLVLLRPASLPSTPAASLVPSWHVRAATSHALTLMGQ